MSRVPIRLPEYVIEWIKEGTHVRVVEPNNASDIQVKLNDVGILGYGVVIVPPGLYMVNKPIYVPSNVALIGMGWGTIIKLADGVASAAYSGIIRNSNHDVMDGNVNIIIAYLQVDGNKANQNFFCIGIDMKGANDSMIIGCYVHDTYADNLGFWKSPKRCMAIGNLCKAAGPAGTGQNGVFVEGEDVAHPAEDCVVANNICIDTGHNGVYLSIAERVTVTGNVCSNNGDEGIQAYKSHNITIAGNVCYSNDDHGIFIRDSDEAVVSGNYVRGSGQHGIYVINSSYCSVNGNSCRSNTYAGIMLDSGVALTVNGNVSSYNGTHGIYVYRCQYSGITCNVCANNSQTTAGNADGIILSDGNSTPYCRYNTVIGNKCFDNQGTPTQRYGIVGVDSEDYNLIVANNCYQNQHGSLDIYYTGSNDKVAWNIGRYEGQGDIREVWAPVTYGSPGLSNWDGHPGVTIDASGEYCSVGLTVPEDYKSTVSVELLFIAHETAASQHLSITTYWGKVGEQRNNHSLAGADRNLGAVTEGQIHSHDVSDLLSPLEAGDVVGFFIQYSSVSVDSNVFILGVRFRYQNKDI